MTCTSVHRECIDFIILAELSRIISLKLNFCTSLSISCKVMLYLCVYLSICINSNNLLVSGPNVKHHIKCNQPQPCLNTLYIATISAYGYGLLSLSTAGILSYLAFHKTIFFLEFFTIQRWIDNIRRLIRWSQHDKTHKTNGIQMYILCFQLFSER